MRFVKTAESILNIPSGFTRVEYLQSSGTQYIDTGVKYDINKTYQIKNKIVYTGTQAQSQGNGWDAGGQNSISSTGDIPVGSDILARNAIGKVIELTQTINSGSSTLSVYNYIVDGISLPEASRSHSSLSQYAGNGGYGIFAMYSTSAYNYFCKAKCYKYKILENNVLVRDFIPCVDPLGRACMYDLVGKKAYYNQGTGEFTVGRQIIPVEYLESTGTQYIDTGIAGSDSLKIGVICQATAQDKAVIGCGTSPSEERLQIFADVNYYSCRLNNVRTVSNVSTLSKATIVLDVPNKKYTINGTEFEINYTGNLSNRNLYLFNRNVVNDGAYGFQGCIWKCWIEDNGVLVRDFIPCKDENNVGFMFDTLSDNVYENAGTGAFVVGPNKYKMKLRLIKDNILPTGYTQVEYLESTGTQYIDTGYIPTNSTGMKLSWTREDNNDRAVMGTRHSSAGDTRFFIGAYSQGMYISWNTLYVVPTTTQINTFYETSMNYKNDRKRVLNGTELSQITETLASINQPIYLFYIPFATNKALSKIKYAQITEGSELVRDFIPALDPSGTPCMYDLVSKTPFYNAGTGTFTTGKPVLPIVRFPVDPIPGYKIVNYLGSDSTAYIDTGVSGANDNLKIEMDFSYSKFYAYGYFFSNYESEQHDTTRFLLDASNNSRGLAYINTKSQNGAIYTPYNLTMNNKHNVIITKTTVSIDGVITTNPSPPVGTANTKNIILFNRGADSYTDKRDVGMRCWSFKIYDNNILVRNFIPVVRLLDNKAGMWDTVSKQFYGNAGTGDFITG